MVLWFSGLTISVTEPRRSRSEKGCRDRGKHFKVEELKKYVHGKQVLEVTVPDVLDPGAFEGDSHSLKSPNNAGSEWIQTPWKIESCEQIKVRGL